jgi:hypothetical protein
MGSGIRNGTMLAMMRTTRCSPKMLPKRRSVSESTRERWLMTSMTKIIGAMTMGTPGMMAKCLM